MFLGTYEPRLDAKGRLILPAKFRDAFSDGLVVTRGGAYCLAVYTPARFAQRYEDICNSPMSSQGSVDYARMWLSGADDQVPDKQGRITIPARLRSYADLQRDLVVIGAGDHLEIWNSQTWEEYLARTEAAFAEMTEGVLR